MDQNDEVVEACTPVAIIRTANSAQNEYKRVMNIRMEARLLS